MTEQDLLSGISALQEVNKLVERIGFAEVLSGLATIAHTNSRLTEEGYQREDQDECAFWEKLSRKLYNQAHKFEGYCK